MNNYLIVALVGLALPIIMHLAAEMKPNPIIGARFSATYADPDVWKKTNQRGAQLLYIFGSLITVVSLAFYLAAVPPDIGGKYLGFGFIAMIVFMLVYLCLYSKNLSRKTLPRPDAAISRENVRDVETSKVSAVLQLVVSISFIFLGIVGIHSHAGTSLGIRVGNVFRDAATWHKVNVLGGAGYIIIGIFFSLVFAWFLPKGRGSRTFYRATILFLAMVLLWTLITAVYAYHA